MLAWKAAIRLGSNPTATVTGAEAKATPEPFALPVHVVGEAERKGTANNQFHDAQSLKEAATTTATAVAVTSARTATAAAAEEPHYDGQPEADYDQGIQSVLLITRCAEKRLPCRAALRNGAQRGPKVKLRHDRRTSTVGEVRASRSHWPQRTRPRAN